NDECLRPFGLDKREARDRIDFRPRLSASFPVSHLARLTPYAAVREDLYVGEVTGTFSHRGYLMNGIIFDTELSRIYGIAGSRKRHSITPSVEFRYVPPVVGAGWSSPYDEVDSAVPKQGLTQAIAQVSQRLSGSTGNSIVDLARMDVGQDFDL